MIILGNGVFSIGEIDIALTRGGGQFVIEREYRNIEADGDKGAVKCRVVLDKSQPKLTMNNLSIIPTDMTKYYPAMKITDMEAKKIVTGTGKIVTADYQDFVKWTGVTDEGKPVIIKVKNAINLENLDWTMADKDEVINALTYQGCYEDGHMDDEPWEVEFV